jgi:hypothetical protein
MNSGRTGNGGDDTSDSIVTSSNDDSEKIYNAKGSPKLRATRLPTFDQWRIEGIEVNNRIFKLNEHAYKLGP